MLDLPNKESQKALFMALAGGRGLLTMSAIMTSDSIRMRVHDRENLRLDGILRLIEEAGKPGPLQQVLTQLCAQIAVIAHADVVSVYVLEGSRLVLRGNVGFPESALGHVKLERGEGIVGTVAEVMRPISVSNAEQETHYKYVPELGEEGYPSFLAVPLFARGEVYGVMVLQRAEATDFSDAEVALATALATTITHALDHERSSKQHTSTRSARLTGRVRVPGTALGRAVMLGTLESIQKNATARTSVDERVMGAFESVATMFRKGYRRVESELSTQLQRRLQTHALVLEDQRLRNTTATHCRQLGLVDGLKQVAREYASATYMTGGADPLLQERAEEIEALCLLVATAACDLPFPGAGTILIVPETLTATVALTLIGCRGEGIAAAVAQRDDSLGAAIANAASVPMLDDVSGLYAWVRQNDTLLLNAEDGALRVNPPATQIARYRHER